MVSSTLINNIVTGIIAGVSAGLILAAFSYGKQHIDYQLERRDQIKYIRQIVEGFQRGVLSAEHAANHPNPPPIENMPTANQFRWVTVESTYEELEKTLEGRAGTLTFKEKKQLLDAFEWYTLFRPSGAFGYKETVIGEAQYHDMFDNLEEIDWLKLKVVDRTSLGPRQ